MTLHVYGAIATCPGVAANNRGETQGNITTLQKLLWGDNIHTTVSAEAIRWALRYYWQQDKSEEVNRRWDDEKMDYDLRDPDFRAWDPVQPGGKDYLDDDLLGFMDTPAGNEEAELQYEIPRRRKELAEALEKKPDDKKLAKTLEEFNKTIEQLKQERKKLNQAIEDGTDTGEIQKKIEKLRKKAGLKAKAIVRRGVLEIARAISLSPFAGDITFNAKAGEKGRTSLYGTEIHATSYQYGFAMTPGRLRVKARAIHAINAIANLGEVAGNHSRFLFDFSPESIVLRMTEDPAPRLLYCFEEGEEGKVSAPQLVRRVKIGDICASELYIGGVVSENPEIAKIKGEGAQVLPGVKETVSVFLAELSSRL